MRVLPSVYSNANIWWAGAFLNKSTVPNTAYSPTQGASTYSNTTDINSLNHHRKMGLYHI